MDEDLKYSRNDTDMTLDYESVERKKEQGQGMDSKLTMEVEVKEHNVRSETDVVFERDFEQVKMRQRLRTSWQRLQ